MVLLKVRSVSKSYEDRAVLSNISLDLHRGEWLGILGESGSGKSTLLRILARYLDADNGEVMLDGKKLGNVADQLIPGNNQIKLIHQEFELFPNQTVYENIAYALRFHDPAYRTERIQELVQLTGLETVSQQKAKVASGGEKQRAAIARALAEFPEVLLLDEPFAHLDNVNRLKLTEAIERVRKDLKMSCVFVTHEAGDVMAWSDRVVVIRKGEIIQLGTPLDIYERPINAYVAELTGPVNWIEAGRSFVRPEKIKLTQSREKAKWEGKIAAIRFRGSYWEYLCKNKKGRFLLYRQKNDRSVGEEIRLYFTEKDIVRLPL